LKLLFLPFSIVGGLLAGLVSKKLFEQVWGLIDKEEPPEAKHREISVGKLAAALALEGAIFRLMRGLAEHGSRQSFAKVMGSWPGEEAPDPE
jgi:hypothetical protein